MHVDSVKPLHRFNGEAFIFCLKWMHLRINIKFLSSLRNYVGDFFPFLLECLSLLTVRHSRDASSRQHRGKYKHRELNASLHKRLISLFSRKISRRVYHFSSWMCVIIDRNICLYRFNEISSLIQQRSIYC